jgi:glycosyltransferase involved in cell wall biosynthesis
MVQSRVSVIVPARNEAYLVRTVQDLLAKAARDVEVVVILDGYWEHRLPADKRVKVLHRGTALGLRAATAAAVQVATGQHLLKCDAHTMWDEGYDVKLRADYHDDAWVLVPRRYALAAEAWTIDDSNPKYPVDYHYLDPSLHGVPWKARRQARKDVLLDDEMSSQGSAWFMSRRCWDRLGPQDAAGYGPFYREFQEIGLKAWLSGGAVKVTKRTWYAHWRKKDRGYPTDGFARAESDAYCEWFWLTDQPFPQRTRNLRWLVEHFAPVPGWPTDLDELFWRAKRERHDPRPVAA